MSLTISIDFAASIARLEEQSKKSADAVRQMADQMEGAASIARTALVGLASAVSVASFTSGVRGAINYADSLNDLTLRAGGTIEVLSGLRLVAQLGDATMESLASGTRKLATNLVENRAAFQSLGISTTDQTEAMIQLGDVFAGMPDPVQRSALAVKVFGKSGEDLIPMLVQGSAAIREQIQLGQEYAGVTAQMAQQAAIFNDNLDILTVRSEGFFLTVSAQMLPVLNETITAFNGVAGAGSAAEMVGGAIATVFETIVVLGAEVSYVFSTVGREIGGIVAQFTAMGEAGGVFTKEGRAAWSLVGEEMRADAVAAKEAHEAFIKSVMTARERAQQTQPDKARTTDNRGSQLLGQLSGASAELDKLRQKDIDGWVKYAEAVLAESEEIERIQRDRILKENEQAAASEMAWQQSLAQRLAALQMAAMSEAEIERGKLLAIETDLQFARENGWLTEQEHLRMKEQAQLEHEARMGNIMAQGELSRRKLSEKSWDMQVSSYAGMLKGLTSQAATSNRTMFELNKAAGISETVVNTYRAAQGAYAALAGIPIVGPFLGAAAAAVAIASGVAQVNAIKSAQFGASTSPPSIAGGTATPVYDASATSVAAPDVPQAAAPRQQMNVTLVGSQFSMQQMVDEFIPLFNEASANGADIRFQTA